MIELYANGADTLSSPLTSLYINSALEFVALYMVRLRKSIRTILASVFLVIVPSR